jgi:hypothetical protein
MAKVPQSAPHVVASFVERVWSKESAEEYIRKQGACHVFYDELNALRDD